MRRLPVMLIMLGLFYSSLGAAEVRTVRRPVIVDDSFTPLSVVRLDPPIWSRPFVLPPGTVLDSSYYDWQRNGTLNRRVWVNADGSVHATYMKSPDQAFVERGMIYYYADAFGNPFTSYGDIATFRNGYGNISAYPTAGSLGANAVVSTHNFGTVESFAFVDAFQGIGAFTELATNSADLVVWPKPSVNSDGSIEIVGTLMNNETVNGINHNVAWDRAPDAATGFSQTWTWLGLDAADWKEATMEFPAIASGDNGKVGIVISDFAAEVHFWESVDNGVSFAETLITTAATDTLDLPADPDSTATVFLPWINSDIVYVGDEPHIVWTAAQGGQSGGVVLYDYRTRILHWSPSTGIDTVVVAPNQGSVPSEVETYVTGGFNHLAVDWPQIGASPDGGRLFAIYVGMDPSDVDSANGIGFGDIWAVYSEDNGETWSDPLNVSNPGGAYPGADDRYPSISPVNYEAAIAPGMDAYIVYQTDNTAGSFLQGEEGANQDYFIFTGIDFPGVGIGDHGPGTGAGLPRAFALGQNYPNPFNPSTSISYQLAERADVRLTIHNVRGQMVRELVHGVQDAGVHSVQWNGRDASGETVASGIYLYVLETDKGFRSTRKMVVLK